MTLVSCFAGAVPKGASVPGLRLVDWPGTAAPGGHPTWSASASQMRAGSAGRLLPGLRKRFRIDADSKLAFIGFSAGFGGVRAALAHPDDRAEIDAAIVLDSIHVPMAPGFKSSEPNTVINVATTLEPFARFAARAAQRKALWVSTWGDLARPNPSVTTAREGNEVLFAALSQLAHDDPPVVPAALLERPRVDTRLWPDEPYPTPAALFGHGDAVGLYYRQHGKTLNAAKHAHIIQASVIRDEIWRCWLCPRWGGTWTDPPGTGKPV